MRREKPVSRSKRSFHIDWSLVGYLLGGLAIIVVVLWVLAQTLGLFTWW